MKAVHRWLKAILGSAMLVLLALCAVVMPTDSMAQNMSGEQARKILATGLMSRSSSMDVDGTRKAITGVRVMSSRMIVTDDTAKQRIFVYRELPQISVSCSAMRGFLCVTLAGKDTFFVGSAREVADALNVLKQNAIRQKKEAAEYDASFAASLDDHRKRAAANAALPEAANKYKVQAEGAVRDKEFDDAADLYAEALKIAPWWPVGRFNRALVLGETGDYESARREMSYYLQLVPDAPNARAAQNKIYEWERLETK